MFISADGLKNLGQITYVKRIENYICSLGSQKGVVIFEMDRVRTKTRFVSNGKAIHPSLGGSEICIDNVFIYPDTEAEPALNNVYARGVLLKGARKPTFVPLIALRSLAEEEAAALQSVSEAKKGASVGEISFERIQTFAESIGIHMDVNSIPEGYLLDIRDPEVSDHYQVKTNKLGVVSWTNVCVSFHEGTYLPEFIVLLREERDLYVYSERW